MKVRLIRPSQLDENGKPRKYEKLFFPDLTLPTLAGLTPEGIDVGITVEYVEDIDFDEKADLIGITAQTCQSPRAYQIADEFRKRGTPTIMGGIHASACPEEALGHVDAVLVGEAEDLWEDVLRDVKGGHLKRVYKAETKPDLSRLAVPRFDLVDFDHYVIPPLARTPLIPLQTTRGCPHDCDFCSVTRFWGHRIRNKPVEHVLKEVEAIQPSRIFFSDDNIGANPPYAMQLFAGLTPLRTRWACQMSTTIGRHPELIEAAAESGCHETLLGLESLNEKNLESIHKGFNKVDEYKSTLKRLADVGILAQVTIMVGLDEDTPDSLRRTMDMLMDMDINYVYLAPLTPLPGTRIRERLEKEQRIVDRNSAFYDFSHVLVRPKNMTCHDLEDVLWEMYETFYAAGNILKRAWRFKRQYFRYFPRDNAIEETFFQFHMRNSVKRKCHPFTLGLAKKPA